MKSLHLYLVLLSNVGQIVTLQYWQQKMYQNIYILYKEGYENQICVLEVNVYLTTLRKKGTKAVTGAVPFQKVHFCAQRLHIGTLVVHIST